MHSAFVQKQVPVKSTKLGIQEHGQTYCCLCRGVLNVVHGSRPAVTGILDHPDIRAVSFVGSDQAGRYIYERGCANGKRVQASSGPRAAAPHFRSEASCM